MKLEDIVCSLELAKRLKELGVRQHSLFAWYEARQINSNNIETQYSVSSTDYHCANFVAAAYTAAELGKMLPNLIQNPRDEHSPFKFKIERFNNKWSIALAQEGGWDADPIEKEFFDEGLVNPLAQMLIYLIENGLVKSGDL